MASETARVSQLLKLEGELNISVIERWAAAQKEAQGIQIRALAVVGEGDSLAMEAEADDFTYDQRNAYIMMLCVGEDYRIAANLIRRTPIEKVLEMAQAYVLRPAPKSAGRA